MSEASAVERWAFLGLPPPPPNLVTLIAPAPTARAGAPVDGPKFDARMCAVLRAALDASDLVASRRAEIEQMLLDELAMEGEPKPPWFEEEIDYQMGEDADPIDRLLEGLAPAVPIERLLENLAGGLPDVRKGEGL